MAEERVGISGGFDSPPREFSLMPFWFWNDELSEGEILRQIADFDDHGVYGFVIHPRVGLPRTIGWMSEALLSFMEMAIGDAKRREMRVMLYDEGMYPSGSSSGQVVAANPEFACRCVAMREGTGELQAGENLIARFPAAGGRGPLAVFDRPVDSYIRGLHYIGEGPAEDEPAMGDILNPAAVAKVIELVYDRFAERFSKYFGNTVIGIFTDEPNPLGKCREQNVWPGTRGILSEINRLLGYDFTPYLPALWNESAPDAGKYREDYQWAIDRRMEETWYRPLSEWCESRGVSLCGHPKNGDEIAVHRFFHIPGQDLVWRFIEPEKPSAIEGAESTQGKNSASAMIHRGRRRNSNEFCGAYGQETTFEEFKWLANWCLVRGVNLLIPHAFYYSVRGARKDERPPQVGPNSAWWGEFKKFADQCRKLCWLNTDSEHVCEVAILTGPDHCPWRAAKVCFQNQIDFNYLELDLILSSANVDAEGVHIAGMVYSLIIVEPDIKISKEIQAKLRPLLERGRVVFFEIARGERDLPAAAKTVLIKDVRLGSVQPNLRVRHVVKEGADYYILFNEGSEPIRTEVILSPRRMRLDHQRGSTNLRTVQARNLSLDSFAVEIFQIE